MDSGNFMEISIRNNQGSIKTMDRFVMSGYQNLKFSDSFYLRNGEWMTIAKIIVGRCSPGDSVIESDITLTELRICSTQIIDIKKFKHHKMKDYTERKNFYDFIEYVLPYVKNNPFVKRDKPQGVIQAHFETPYQLNAQISSDRFNCGYGTGKHWGHTSTFKITGLEYW